jgi:predicted acylesterase/phospholipase RssA
LHYLLGQIHAVDVFSNDLENGVAKDSDYWIGSMSLPYYFQPFKCPIKGTLFSDGGLVTNFPLHYISEEQRAETLGVCILYAMNETPTIELQDFITRPLQIFLSARSQSDSLRYPSQTIVITLTKSSATDFGMELDEKMKLVEMGRSAAKDFLRRFCTPVRRYSVS